jgi:hypothetical protein
MALSPNYGWSEPDNSSLVKDGAQAMRTLGDAIDTSVWNVGFGQAGKNKIINGDFGIWQRGTSFNAASNAFTADRWDTLTDKTGASVLTTQQAFTAGTAPVGGYESQFFLRTVFPAGGTFCIQEQRIENVRTFAGQTITLSFWAKANATVSIEPAIVQNFGSGGSADVQTVGSTFTLTTSWVRYSTTVTLPSISGKTIGAGNYLAARVMRAVTASGFTIDLWGVQLEYGSKATPFQTASGGSPQAELAMCQRYFERLDSALGTSFNPFGTGQCTSTTQAYSTIYFTYKRTSPSISFSAAATFQQTGIAGAGIACSAISSAASGVNSALILGTVAAGLIAGNATSFYRNASAAAFIDISAEL